MTGVQIPAGAFLLSASCDYENWTGDTTRSVQYGGESMDVTDFAIVPGPTEEHLAQRQLVDVRRDTVRLSGIIEPGKMSYCVRGKPNRA